MSLKDRGNDLEDRIRHSGADVKQLELSLTHPVRSQMKQHSVLLLSAPCANP